VFYAVNVTDLLRHSEKRIKTTKVTASVRKSLSLNCLIDPDGVVLTPFEPSYPTPKRLSYDVGATLRLMFASQIVDKHLLYRLVVRAQHMADGVSADKMANFLSQIFRVIARALERLRHKEYVKRFCARSIVVVLKMADEDKVAQPVHLGVSP